MPLVAELVLVPSVVVPVFPSMSGVVVLDNDVPKASRGSGGGSEEVCGSFGLHFPGWGGEGLGGVGGESG